MYLDEWKNCPKCKSDMSVYIENVDDYILCKSGAIISDMHGVCLACGMTFKINHRT